MNIEQLKQFIKQVGWGMLATTDGRKVGVSGYGGLRPDKRPPPVPLFPCSPALLFTFLAQPAPPRRIML